MLKEGREVARGSGGKPVGDSQCHGFLIFFQESCMPVWNQYRIYMQEDSYDTRDQTAAVVLAVQLG